MAHDEYMLHAMKQGSSILGECNPNLDMKSEPTKSNVLCALGLRETTLDNQDRTARKTLLHSLLAHAS